jgi:hypothetical protein
LPPPAPTHEKDESNIPGDRHVISTDIYQKEVESTNRKPQSRGFILSLFCIALFLAFANLLFPPSTSDSGQTKAVWLVGP